MNAKPLIKPILNNLPFLYNWFSLGTGGTDSARYCYAIWMRHLVMAHKHGMVSTPRVVAELGPGDSIGAGLAALLSGADEYYALDVKEFANTERNLKIFDELVELFQKQAPIPDETEFPLINIRLEDYGFPAKILTKEMLNESLNKKRLDEIRNAIRLVGTDKGAPEPNIKIKYYVPWNDPAVIKTNSVDFIFTQAVMEHVADLESTYKNLFAWLRPGGLASHDIDFRSHNTTWSWNGHWRCPNWLWRIILGRAPFPINRSFYSEHLDLQKLAGFEILEKRRKSNYSGISRKSLSKKFEDMPEKDLYTQGAWVLNIKDNR